MVPINSPSTEPIMMQNLFNSNKLFEVCLAFEVLNKLEQSRLGLPVMGLCYINRTCSNMVISMSNSCKPASSRAMKMTVLTMGD